MQVVAALERRLEAPPSGERGRREDVKCLVRRAGVARVSPTAWRCAPAGDRGDPPAVRRCAAPAACGRPRSARGCPRCRSPSATRSDRASPVDLDLARRERDVAAAAGRRRCARGLRRSLGALGAGRRGRVAAHASPACERAAARRVEQRGELRLGRSAAWRPPSRAAAAAVPSGRRLPPRPPQPGQAEQRPHRAAAAAPHGTNDVAGERLGASRPASQRSTDAPTSANGPSCRRPPWPSKRASSGDVLARVVGARAWSGRSRGRR